MLSTNDEDDYVDILCATLDKSSVEIQQDLKFQSLNATSEVHSEELCGWTVSSADLNRFRWNLQRKVAKTPTKDLKITRKTNFRSEIEFEFKHYRHLSNYIEQYRYTKQQKVNSDLSQNDSMKSDKCKQCSSSFETSKSGSPSLNVGIKSNSKQAQLFRGTLYGSRVFQSKEAVIPEHGALYNHSCKQPAKSLNDETWAVIGVEKRRLPAYNKPRTDTRTRPRHQIDVNNSATLLKTNPREAAVSLGAHKGLRTNARSNSAPNIGSFSRHLPLERKSESSTCEVDYSSYTEMFKNVLEYYGTKKLKPKQKPGSAGSVRILSMKS